MLDGSAFAAILLELDHPQPLGPRVSQGDIHSLVGTPIVDDDYFVIELAVETPLGFEVLNGFAKHDRQSRGLVVSGHDDTEAQRGGVMERRQWPGRVRRVWRKEGTFRVENGARARTEPGEDEADQGAEEENGLCTRGRVRQP
jgi:hypothetical protein